MSKRKAANLLVVIEPGDLRANRVILLLQLLRGLGYGLEVHVLRVNRAGEEPVQYGTDFELTIRDVWGIFRLRWIGKPIFKAFGAFCMLRNELRKCSVIFIVSDSNLASAVLAKVFFKKRVFYDVRELFLFGVNSNISTWKRLFLDKWERLFLKYVDAITTMDSHRDIWIERYRRINQNVVVVYNVPSVMGPELDEIRNRIKERRLEGVIHVAIVGAIKPGKGIEKIAEACKLIPRSVHLHLVGKIEGDFVSDLEEVIKTGNHGCRIFVKPWMPYNDLVRYISQFHLGLVLKQPDVGQYGWIGRGNSRKAFTYMHAGLPVIAPSQRSVALQIEEENCGYRVDVRDPREIAQAIVSIIDDPKRYFLLAFNGVEAIEKKYNWEKESLKVIELFGKHNIP